MSINNPDDAPRISKAIDDMFANSPYETKTETEQAFAAGWVKQMGNIEALIMTIGVVVFFTLLLVTGNTMAISVRERTGGVAVFKAVGFTDRSVLFFVLAESLLIAFFGEATSAWRWPVCSQLPLAATPLNGLLPILFLSYIMRAPWG